MHNALRSLLLLFVITILLNEVCGKGPRDEGRRADKKKRDNESVFNLGSVINELKNEWHKDEQKPNKENPDVSSGVLQVPDEVPKPISAPDPAPISTPEKFQNQESPIDMIQKTEGLEKLEDVLVSLRDSPPSTSPASNSDIRREEAGNANCPDTSPKCQNGGFLDSECKCVCPDIIQGNACTDLYEPGPGPTEWPRGTYGIPQPSTGCPGGPWGIGSRTHPTETAVRFEAGLKMTTNDKGFAVESFCIRSEDAAQEETGEWPKGTYCLYQQGDTCPVGFSSGWTLYKDSRDLSDTITTIGSQPKSDYTEGTKYYYCCRSDGEVESAIELPTQQPFMLFRYGKSCQQVKDMHTHSYSVKYDYDPYAIKTENPQPLETSSEGHTLSFCYYSAQQYDCGGIHELTDMVPSVAIAGPTYQENNDNAKECIWLIRGPTGRYLTVNFNNFHIEEDTEAGCVDGLEVRNQDLFQPGEKFCGTSFQKSLIFTNGHAALILHTGSAMNNAGFDLTARLVHDDELYINREDRGSSYRGLVDYTETYTKCAKWEDVRHCSVDLLDDKYANSGLMGNNHCRNPNNRYRPWCYVNEYCEYDYCDVSGIGNCIDLFDDCEAERNYNTDYCSTPEASKGCQKTCELCATREEKTVTSCPAPEVKDKNAVIEEGKAGKMTFTLGEKVKLVCKDQVDGAPVTSELTCNSDGTFSGMQLFCGVSCPAGWTRSRDTCYEVSDESVSYSAAVEACRSKNSHLTSIRDARENAFIKSKLGGKSAWIGLTESQDTGEWRWEDDSIMSYFNWSPTRREDTTEKCIFIGDDGTWNTNQCDENNQHTYICKKKHNVFDPEFYSVDEESDCLAIIQRHPHLCLENNQFALEHCRKTCSVTEVSDLKCENPGTAENTEPVLNDNSMPVGHYFTYTCQKGYSLLSGDLVRACVLNGSTPTLTGSQPVCRPESKFSHTYGKRVMPRIGEDEVRKLTVYKSNATTIKYAGQVKQWQVYSPIRTSLLALVWRHVKGKDESIFTIVGRSLLSLHSKRINKIDLLPGERFSVQPGDVIGWYAPGGSQGPVFTDCEESTESQNIKMYEADESYIDEVKVNMEKSLTKVSTCKEYSISLTVAPGEPDTYSNVAAADRGGQCTGSSSGTPRCGLAIDGGPTPEDSAWSTDNEGPGAYMNISFNDIYNLKMARFMQGASKSGQIENITLTFSDGSEQKVRLSERQGTDQSDMTAVYWDTFTLNPVLSNSVSIRVDSVYSTDFNNIIEAEFYAACTDGWTHNGNKCYKLIDTPLTATDAEEDCSKMSANLTSIDSSGENKFVSSFASSHEDVWIGLVNAEKEDEKAWLWRDGSKDRYTNWDEKQTRANLLKGCALLKPRSGTWKASDCKGFRLPYVCERKADNVIEPAESIYGNAVTQRAAVDKESKMGFIFLEDDAPVSGRYELLHGYHDRGTKLKVPRQGSIKAWKLYVDANVTVTMMVLRPVHGVKDRYVFEGENTVSLQGKVTNVIEIPKFDRIKVEPGYVIAWYYIPGTVPAIPYDECTDFSEGTEIKYVRHPRWDPLRIGQELQATVTLTPPCRIYSVGYILTSEQEEYENVGALTSLGECNGASSGRSVCKLALDKGLYDWSNAWVAQEPGPGEFINVQFSDNFTIEGIRIMQRLCYATQIKTLQIYVGNGRIHDVVLRQRFGEADNDYRAQQWDVFAFDPPIETDSIIMAIKDVYTPGKVGIIEAEFYSKGCPSGWGRFKGNCYQMNGRKMTFEASESACNAEGGHLSTVSDKDEETELVRMSNGKRIYLGYKREGDKWIGVDGSRMRYTAWMANKPEARDLSKTCVALGSDNQWEHAKCTADQDSEDLLESVCKKEVKTNLVLSDTTWGNEAIPLPNKDVVEGYYYMEKSESLRIPIDGHIKEWKIYSDSVADVVMVVLRPLADSKTAFEIIGENKISLPEKETIIAAIPEFLRIQVKAGDRVGWYYVVGHDPSIPYSLCSDDEVRVLEARHNIYTPVGVGQRLEMNFCSNLHRCRKYSIGYTISQDQTKTYFNVAQGRSCTASSSVDTCSLALDGSLFAYGSAWVSMQREGAWYQVTLPDTLSVSGTCILQRLSSKSAIRELEVEFADGSKQKFQMHKIVNSGHMDYRKAVHDCFEFKSNVYTNTVKFTVKSMYDFKIIDNPEKEEYKAGFIEAQVWSTGCRENWNQFRRSCYELQDKKLSREEAEKECSKVGAELPTIRTEEENDFIHSLSQNDTWLGNQRISTKGYHEYGYENWAEGQPEANGNCVSMDKGKWRSQDCQRTEMNWVMKKRAITGGPKMVAVGGEAEPRCFTRGYGEMHILDRSEFRFFQPARVVAWRFYSSNKTLERLGPRKLPAVFSVWRKVRGEMTYALVGSTTIQTTGDGRAGLAKIPRAFQIHVRPGDTIGLQFPMGDSGIEWDNCNNDRIDRKTLTLKYNWTSPNPGDTYEFKLATDYHCRMYSVAAIIKDPELTPFPKLTNIAQTSLGTTCTASVYTGECEKAIDGYIDPASAWIVKETPVINNWITLRFCESYRIQYIRLMQTFGKEGQTNVVRLDFSDGSFHEVTLKQRFDGSADDSRNSFWDDFEIPVKDTNFIKFTIASTYTEKKNGFVEIQVLAACPSGYERHKDGCYKLFKKKLNYFDAHSECLQENAKLVTVNNEPMNIFLKSLASGQHIWLGLRNNDNGYPGGVWRWEGDDKNPATYTDWAKDKPGRDGQCTTLNRIGKWANADCENTTLFYVCQTAVAGPNRNACSGQKEKKSRYGVLPSPSTEAIQNRRGNRAKTALELEGTLKLFGDLEHETENMKIIPNENSKGEKKLSPSGRLGRLKERSKQRLMT